MTAAEILAQAREERDTANAQREREWHRANEAEKARDAALAELSQARAERDMAKSEHVRLKNSLADAYEAKDRAWSACTRVEQERDAAVKRAEACESKYGRAVAALRELREWWTNDGNEQLPWIENADAILADASSTQAANAWRAQQEERRKLRRFIQQHMHDDHCECGFCVDARDTLAEIDARKAGDKCPTCHYAECVCPWRDAPVDAWRAQQEERAELEAVYQAVIAYRAGTPGAFVKLREACFTAAAKVDAQRAGGKDGAK